MNSKLKKTLFLGYLYGTLSALLGTIGFTFLNAFIYILRNGWILKWDYLSFFLIPGCIISFFPAGLAGIVLSYLLWKDFKNNILTERRAYIKGGKIGVICMLFVISSALLTPLKFFVIHMSSGIAIQYFLISFILSFVLAGWAGKRLAMMLLSHSD